MSLLSKKMKKIKKAKDSTEQILLFDERGRPIKEKKPIKKWPIITVASIGAVLGFLYIPAAITIPAPATSYPSKVSVNSETIRASNTYIKTYPDEDFDNDGLLNSIENNYGTNPHMADTDDDGLTDYIEIYNLNSSPVSWGNGIQSQVSTIDEKNGEATGTPFKIDNVVMWADNLYSKSYGGVVRTIDGYQFSNFTGWVQFAEDGYAYQYVDGIHKELDYREAENAYRIDENMRVVISGRKMTKLYRFEYFGETAYLENNTFAEILDAILPDYGNKAFLKCYPVMDVDRDGNGREDRIVEIVAPDYVLNDSRFALNHNTFDVLSKVFTAIDSGKTVPVSLFRDNYGETIVIAYGYTSEGDLLVANSETLEPVGKILINERCGRKVNQEGLMEIQQWFTFSGLNYSTSNRSRMVFLFEDNVNAGIPYVPENTNPVADETFSDVTEENVETTITTTTPIAISENTTSEEVTEIAEETDTTEVPEETAQETDISSSTRTTTAPATTTIPEITEVPDTTTLEEQEETGEFDFANL